MPITFSRSMRSLQADSFRRPIVGLFVIILFFGLWFAWLVGAKVTIYKVSSAARLEVAKNVYPIETPIGGRVTTMYVQLNQKVAKKEIK
jgi:multidrug efflux pump subunit AcrA (membrane-fusion protein)